MIVEHPVPYVISRKANKFDSLKDRADASFHFFSLPPRANRSTFAFLRPRTYVYMPRWAAVLRTYIHIYNTRRACELVTLSRLASFSLSPSFSLAFALVNITTSSYGTRCEHDENIDARSALQFYPDLRSLSFFAQLVFRKFCLFGAYNLNLIMNTFFIRIV